MSKGIYNIALVPYDQHYILTVCVGLTMEEVLDKFRIGGDIYSNPPPSLRSIKKRSMALETIKSEFDHFKIKDHLIKIQNGTTGGSVFSSDALDMDKTMFMFLPVFDYKASTKEEWTKFLLTLSHEVIHVCQFFLPKFFKRDEEAEAEAYFHDYVLECIIEAHVADLFH